MKVPKRLFIYDLYAILNRDIDILWIETNFSESLFETSLSFQFEEEKEYKNAILLMQLISWVEAFSCVSGFHFFSIRTTFEVQNSLLYMLTQQKKYTTTAKSLFKRIRRQFLLIEPYDNILNYGMQIISIFALYIFFVPLGICRIEK